AFLHDISERKLSERLLLAQHAVTDALAAAASPQHAIEALLAALGESLGWEAGTYWAVVPDAAVLQTVARWQAAVRAREAAELEWPSGEALASGVGLPGRAWEERQPVWSDFTAETSIPRSDAALRASLPAVICIPAL